MHEDDDIDYPHQGGDAMRRQDCTLICDMFVNGEGDGLRVEDVVDAAIELLRLNTAAEPPNEETGRRQTLPAGPAYSREGHAHAFEVNESKLRAARGHDVHMYTMHMVVLDPGGSWLELNARVRAVSVEEAKVSALVRAYNLGFKGSAVLGVHRHTGEHLSSTR